MNLVRRSLAGLRRRPGAVALNMTALVGALVFFGLSFSAFRLLQDLPPPSRDPLPAVVELRPELDDAAGRELAARLTTWPELREARWVSAEDSWERLRQRLGPWRSILDGFPQSPLPAVIEVVLRPSLGGTTDVVSLSERLAQLPGVAAVKAPEPLAREFTSRIQAGRALFAMLMALAVLIKVVISHQGVSGSLCDRADELAIYRLVGADLLAHHGPFYLEALGQGWCAAGLAWPVVQLLIHFGGQALPRPLVEALPWPPAGAAAMLSALLGAVTPAAMIGCRLALRRLQP